MAKESNGKIISMLKEVLAKVGGGSGEVEIPISCEYKTLTNGTSYTKDIDGKGYLFLHSEYSLPGDQIKSVVIDDVEVKDFLDFYILFGNSTTTYYKIPFKKSLHIEGKGQSGKSATIIIYTVGE